MGSGEEMLDVQALYARLAEAEEKLRAIQDGSVDAFVVQGPDGPKVYTLQSADHPYRLLVEQMQDSALTLSRDGRILYCNSCFMHLVARPDTDIVGASLCDFVIASDRTKVQAAISEANTRPLRMNFALATQGASGTVPVHAAMSPLATDEFEGSVAVLTDLTELYRSKAIAQSERMKRLILDQASDAILLCDRGGRVIWANQAALDWFGKRVLGTAWDELCGDQPDLRGCCERREEMRGVPLHHEGEHGALELLVSAKVLESEDDALGWVITFTDISAVRRVEHQLRDADQRKDRFLAMLAHELRNPLAPIRNAVEIQKLVAMQDPQLDHTRDIIERQVQHLSRLIDDLLDVSRITQGKIRLEHKPVAVTAIVAGAVDVARPFIEARRQQLSIAGPKTDAMVDGDYTRLVQALGNLLNNASKFSGDSAQISIGAEEDVDHVLIRVRDCGYGIAPEFLPHVFELFSQSKDTLDRSQGGLGIGLALVRRLIEMHGGSVSAHSEGLNKGSEFVIRLPRLAERREAEPARSGSVRAGASRRILVVDDNVDAADTLARLLSLQGHEVQVAHDATAALTLARSMRPHFALLDIGLPGMDGYQLATLLRDCPEARNTTLFALTGYGQEQDRRRSQQAGFAHHLVKPIDLPLLMSLIA